MTVIDVDLPDVSDDDRARYDANRRVIRWFGLACMATCTLLVWMLWFQVLPLLSKGAVDVVATRVA